MSMARFRALLAFFVPISINGVKDTLLEEDFCQLYYYGSGDCHALKQHVRVNHSRSAPTFEMGDPSKPAMMFFHGWPDTGALWVNQFEHFCAPPNGQYFCVAPTWMNFHPDLPDAPPEELFIDVQIDKMRATAKEMDLKAITLVIFDWGAAMGYMFATRYPDLVKKVVAFDIALSLVDPPGSKQPSGGDKMIPYLPEYQQANIKAFRTNDITPMQPMLSVLKQTVWRGITPKFFQARTGWPYNCIVLNGEGEDISQRFAPEVPLKKWKFQTVPDFPSNIPLLFLYGLCEDGTGRAGIPCKKRSMLFFEQSFLDWMKERPDSDASSIDGAGHWMMTLAASSVNQKMSAWLGNPSALVV